MVVLGNPPYSGHSATKSDSGSKKKLWIEERVNDYKWVDGLPLGEANPKWLQDDYVKFIRFGQWRIEQTGSGILAFITNHAYLDNPTFRGMRQNLMKTFDRIYVLNLHGNSKKQEKCPDGSPDQNVFDIQQGVAITLFIKSPKPSEHFVKHADLWGRRDGKDVWLAANDVTSTVWQDLRPSSPAYLFIPQDETLRAEYEKGIPINKLMPVNSVGIVTARDDLTIAFTKEELIERIKRFVSLTPDKARDEFELGKDSSDWTVERAQQDVKAQGKWEAKIIPILYRPFDIRYTIYTGNASGFLCRPRPEVMKQIVGGENIAVIMGRSGAVIGSHEWDIAFATNCIVDLNIFRRGGGQVHLCHQMDTRSLKKELSNSQAESVGYVYSIVFSTSYRTRFSEYLRLDYPRIPFTSNPELFGHLAKLGQELIDLHLLHSLLLDKTEVNYPVSGSHRVERGSPKFIAAGENDIATGKPLVKGRAFINGEKQSGYSGQCFEGIERAVWEFHIGGYQVLDKWLKERRGRVLTQEDREHFKRVVKALRETIRVMGEIDSVIEDSGWWPIT